MSFVGVQYRLANEWFQLIDVNKFKNVAINYLEIGVFYGANLLSVADTYCLHINSKLYCIDPWEDYDEYPEKYSHNNIYNMFLENINNSPHKDKINIHKGYSNNILHTFENNFFDIIYIDGNHEPEYVLEDAVLSFRKLKKGGFMIFDDFGWGGPDLTQRGIEAFISGYHKRINIIGFNCSHTQIVIQKMY